MEEITQFMRDNLDSNMTIEDLANHFGYSKYYFCRKFKKNMGISPNLFWSSLKIEQTYIELEKKDSVLHAHLQLGYLSSGTFSNAFSKSTGMTPSEYKKNLEKFYRSMHAQEKSNERTYYFHSFNSDDYRTYQTHALKVYVETPDDFRGTIFIGIFDSTLPNELPVVGKAMFKKRLAVIDKIPNGTYYAMVVAISKGAKPIDYFHLDNALRDIDRSEIVFPLKEDVEILLKLREKIADDPPITINPVKLLLEAIKKGNVE